MPIRSPPPHSRGSPLRWPSPVATDWSSCRRNRLAACRPLMVPSPSVPTGMIPCSPRSRATASRSCSSTTRNAIIFDGLFGAAVPGVVSGEQRTGSTISRTNARLRGYQAGAEAAGLNWARLPVYAAGSDSIEAGQAAGEAVLDGDPDLTAILTTTDRLAAGVLAAARLR